MRRLAKLQCPHEEAGQAARLLRCRQVMNDVRVVEVQRAAGRYVAVPLFRHRERDDIDRRRGEHVERRRRAGLAVDHRDDAADHSRLDAIVLADQAGIKSVLPAERRGKPGVANIDADDAPSVEAVAEQIVGVFRLVATMEGADPDVGHAGRELRPIVSRLLDGLRQPLKR